MQVKKELVAMHAANMEAGVGRQRTYGALTDGCYLLLLCYDAGEGFQSWQPGKDLTGTLTRSRCSSATVCTCWARLLLCRPKYVL